MQQRAVLIGSSGLVGSYLMELLLKDDDFSDVTILVRKKSVVEHPKLKQVIIDFNNIDEYWQMGSGDIIFCCVGTTTKKVNGDIKTYEKIDVDIPVNAARIGIEQNFRKYLVVSSAGANENSRNFYLKLKGRLETALKKYTFDNLSIFRPGQLLGKRNEYRKGEQILQKGTKLISFFLFGSLKKYHSIEASKVAKAMIAESKRTQPGVRILEYNEMMSLINKDQHLQ